MQPRRVCAALVLHVTAIVAQWLPPTPHLTLEEHMAPTYPGERCAFYDVHRVRTRAGSQRRWLPRLGSLSARPSHLPNFTIVDGYGTSRARKQVPCTEDAGEKAWQLRMWSVLLCAPYDLVPLAPPGVPGSVSVLLVSSDHNNHGFFAQVERVLNQLHLADTLGLVPSVYLGRKVRRTAAREAHAHVHVHTHARARRWSTPLPSKGTCVHPHLIARARVSPCVAGGRGAHGVCDRREPILRCEARPKRVGLLL